MALRPGLLTGSLTLLALAAACGGGERVVIEWAGADTGRATLSATAIRCAGEIQLFATSGDTGVALLLYPSMKVRTATELPILAPTDAKQTRPAAAVAARWLDSTRVDGYRGVKGTVRLTDSKQAVSGDFRSQLRREGDQAEVTLTGQIRRVTIGTCADSAG
ncbi:MAG TPA: hypothetical protein VFL88_08180 [Gemmatimonadales bacterium]|jgi:hypothetical protein|nr:hypothetical protein [Gemmatimonadales bacterium]